MIPPRWSGRVVGVYNRAVNILHPGGFLVSVVADALSFTPHSVLVAERFFSQPPLVGAAARFSAGSLVTAGTPRIELDRAAVDWGTLSSEAANRARRLLPGAAAAAWKLLAEVAPADSLAAALLGGGQSRFAVRVTEALPSTSPPRVEDLVGLGPGLTPAGDDFLAGFAVGLEVMGPDASDALSRLRGRISALLGNTTSAGRSLLRAAIQGCHPAYLLALVEGIGNPQVAIQIAGDHGATSGFDALSGLLWAVSGVLERNGLTPPRFRL